MRLAWEYLNGPMVQCWGVVLLHFVWQGFLIAGLTSLALRRSSARDASHRYTLTLAGLLLMVAAPTLTFFLVDPPSVAHQLEASHLATTTQVAHPLRADASHTTGDGWNLITDAGFPATTGRTGFRATEWSAVRAILCAIWLGVQLCLLARLALGAVVIWRIRRVSEQVSEEIAAVARTLARRLQLGHVPEILSSRRIGDAAAFGFFKGVVLLPSAWLTDMSPEMIEAILAHELSHIRRHDAWVNLLQRLLESAFFYHPAVWWLSRRIRVEREHRSDADAVRMTGKPGVFAKTLEHVARHGAGMRLEWVSNLGADKMSLLNRVDRVLNQPKAFSGGGHWQLGLLALLVPLLLVLSSPKPASHAEEQASGAEQPLAPDGYYSSNASETSQVIESAAVDVSQLPTELNKIRLPAYVVEPPDVLLVEAIRLVPKKYYELGPSDVLQVTANEPGASTRRIAGDYPVNSNGAIELGVPYGSLTVAGLSVIEARVEIQARLAAINRDATVSVALAQIGDRQKLSGHFLVGPDGELGLGRYGRVQVSGKTIPQARREVEKQLSKYFDNPSISLDVFAYNSKVFYVILENNADTQDDQVIRIPITGNETVLDAIAQVGGLDSAATKSVWISRPSPGGLRQGSVLPVSWKEIARGASTETNYQLLPGDRLFLSDRSPVAANSGRATDHRAKAKEVAEGIDALRESRLAEIELRRALRRKIVARFDATPLEQALETVSKQLEVNLFMDTKGMAMEGVDRNTLITLDLRQSIKAKNLLQLILEPLHLTYRIQHGVIRVTSEMATSPTLAVTYDVSDLLTLPTTTDVDDSSAVETLDYEQLISLISTTVAPDSWGPVGGRGAIAAFRSNQSLVVSQTQNVHAQVKALLDQLRDLKQQQGPMFRR